MATIEGGPIMVHAGPPVAGTDEIQTLTIGSNSEPATFKLSYEGAVTEPISWGSDNAALTGAIQAALEALPTLGAGSVTVAPTEMVAGVGKATVSFKGPKAGQKASLLGVAPVEGPTVQVGVEATTPGTNGTGYAAPKGAVLIDSETPGLYQNHGTASSPDWRAV